MDRMRYMAYFVVVSQFVGRKTEKNHEKPQLV
jgi:hypothetical protein